MHWDDYDQRSHQLYSEGWKVIGADSGAGEDGTDDTITSRGAADIVRFSSEGRASTEREIVIELDLPRLDEDPGVNTDEIKVEVSLDPVGPFAVEETSNRILVAAELPLGVGVDPEAGRHPDPGVPAAPRWVGSSNVRARRDRPVRDGAVPPRRGRRLRHLRAGPARHPGDQAARWRSTAGSGTTATATG